MATPRVIVVAGPTASGKTALAVALARRLRTEIISADSRQFYRELPIGSAMPSAEELEAATHHFIACRSVTEEYTAGSYAADARPVLQRLLSENGSAVVCGGSGLYIQALLFGMDDFPAVTAQAAGEVAALWEREGIEGLRHALSVADPDYYRETDLYNPARLRRALEVCLTAGKPYSSFRTRSKTPGFSFSAFGLEWPKTELHERIHRRVDQMVKDGLEEEARHVYPLRHLKPLRTVGYEEFFDHFDGRTRLPECVDLIKTHTRQYAKRQLTWFRRQLPVTWVKPEQAAETVMQTLPF